MSTHFPWTSTLSSTLYFDVDEEVALAGVDEGAAEAEAFVVLVMRFNKGGNPSSSSLHNTYYTLTFVRHRIISSTTHDYILEYTTRSMICLFSLVYLLDATIDLDDGAEAAAGGILLPSPNPSAAFFFGFFCLPFASDDD